MPGQQRDDEPLSYHRQGLLRDEGNRIANLQRLMCDLQDLLEAEPDLVRHPCFGNALMNLAVNKILDDEGPAAAASILIRVADAVSSGLQPEGTLAVRLNDADA
ncbi:MAG: hypothetical protein ACR2RE_01980 [Geminicoccaceae bacterium]